MALEKAKRGCPYGKELTNQTKQFSQDLKFSKLKWRQF